MIAVELRDAAAASLFDQADYFTSVANASLARRWETGVDQTILQLKRFPTMGSPCFFRHPGLSDLRRIPIAGFPRHLLFYRFEEAANLIIVFDILHGARDLESLLTPPESEE